MKQLLLVLVIAAVGYWYWTYLQHPEVRACSHFADLCGADSKPKCGEALDGLGKALSAEEISRTHRCVAEATTCSQATGCLVGGAGRAGLNTAGDFLRGVREALEK